MNWSSSSVAIVSLSLLAPSALLVGCNRPAEMSSATAVPTASETAGTPSESVIPTPGAIAGGESSTSAAEPSDTISLQIADVPQLREQLKNLTGKVVVVDIWSTSCLPCMREFPNLVQLSQRYPDQITCVSFNVDYIGMKSKTPESYTDKVEKFLREQSAVQVVNVLSATPDFDVLTEFEVESIPAILIFDASGELAFRLTDSNASGDGLTYEGDVIPKIEQLLAQ